MDGMSRLPNSQSMWLFSRTCFLLRSCWSASWSTSKSETMARDPNGCSSSGFSSVPKRAKWHFEFGMCALTIATMPRKARHRVDHRHDAAQGPARDLGDVEHFVELLGVAGDKHHVDFFSSPDHRPERETTRCFS